MKIFVTGVNGQLGHDVIYETLKRGYEVIGSDINDSTKDYPYIKLDITNEEDVLNTIKKVRPDALIHCAGYTNVDGAQDINNHEIVDKINHLGTLYLAKAIKEIDAKMIYISTDYIFDGKGELPHKEDDINYRPLNYYGLSKLNGELAIKEILDKYFIVRISWAFGINGNNFVKTMLKLSDNHSEIKVVNDQIGSPTYTLDLSRLLIDMIETDKYGIYHATNEGDYISWYDFTREIFKLSNKKTNVMPVSTKEYGLSKAKRPYNSRLNKTKLIENGFKPLPTWQNALKRYLKELGYESNKSNS